MKNLNKIDTTSNSYLVNKMFPPKKQTTSDKVFTAMLCIFFLSLCFGWFFILTGFTAAFLVTGAVAFIGSMANINNNLYK